MFFGIGEQQGRGIAFKWATAQPPQAKNITDGHWYADTELLEDFDALKKYKKNTLGKRYQEFFQYYNDYMNKKLGINKWIPQVSMHRRSAEMLEADQRKSFLGQTANEKNTKSFDNKKDDPLNIGLNPAVVNYYLTSPTVHPHMKRDVQRLGMMKAVRKRMGDRFFGIHDLYHVLLGVGRDQLGEMCIQCKNAVDSGLYGLHLVTWLEACREAVIHLSLTPFKIRKEAYRLAKLSEDLLVQDYKKLLKVDVDKIRKDLNIQENKIYQDFCGVTHENDLPKGKYRVGEYGI